MLTLPVSRPARDYDEAMGRAAAFAALDDERILPQSRSALFQHGCRTPLAVVLLHGYTNSPAQYVEFAPTLYDLGVNVFAPRLPEHGDRNRMTDRIAGLTAQALLASAGEALDIAAGLGERSAVLGISMGGTLAAYFAQHRATATAVPVAPEFALLRLPYAMSRSLAWVLGVLPNFFSWWDPRAGIEQRPLTAYPRFSTHGLVETLRVADDVHAACQREPHRAQRIVTVVNRVDPAVNNKAARYVSDAWAQRNRGTVEYVELDGLPANHDIIDPANPLARTAEVYPVLLSALGVAPAGA